MKSPSRYRQILLLGNVATGKSTLMTNLTAALNAAGQPTQAVPADELYKTNPFFTAAVQDRTRWSLASDLWFLKERLKISETFPQLLEKQNLVVDSGLPMSLVYAHSRLHSGYFTTDEWNLYQSYYQHLVDEKFLPDIVIYLRAPVTLLMERMKERGREFEIKNHTVAYLESLAESLEYVTGELEKAGVKVIQTTSAEVMAQPQDLVKKIAAIG